MNLLYGDGKIHRSYNLKISISISGSQASVLMINNLYQFIITGYSSVQSYYRHDFSYNFIWRIVLCQKVHRNNVIKNMLYTTQRKHMTNVSLVCCPSITHSTILQKSWGLLSFFLEGVMSLSKFLSSVSIFNYILEHFLLTFSCLTCAVLCFVLNKMQRKSSTKNRDTKAAINAGFFSTLISCKIASASAANLLVVIVLFPVISWMYSAFKNVPPWC